MVGLFFDFDGTIALSEPVHMAAWEQIAREHDRPLPHGFLEKGVGATDAELALDLSVDPHWRGGPTADWLLERKRALYQERCRKGESTLVPGIVEALSRFAERHPLALCTSASEGDIAPTLAAHDLRRFFRVVLTIESVERAKPHPEIYLKAAALLGVDPAAGLVFEDSPMGAAAGRAAGMTVVGMTTTFPPGGIGPVALSIEDYRDLRVIDDLIAGLAVSRRALP